MLVVTLLFLPPDVTDVVGWLFESVSGRFVDFHQPVGGSDCDIACTSGRWQVG